MTHSEPSSPTKAAAPLDGDLVDHVQQPSFGESRRISAVLAAHITQTVVLVGRSFSHHPEFPPLAAFPGIA